MPFLILEHKLLKALVFCYSCLMHFVDGILFHGVCFAVGNHLYRYSKVLDSHNVNEARARVMPTCPHLVWAQPHPLNFSAPT